MQLILQGAEINEREMVLEIRTAPLVGATEAKRRDSGIEGKLRFEPPVWLPGLVPQSVVLDRCSIRLPSLVVRCRKETRSRVNDGRQATADRWQGMIEDGTVKNRSQLARRLGVSRARVTKALGSPSN